MLWINFRNMHSVDTLGVSAGQRVLLLWSGNQAVEKLQQNVELLTRKVGETGKVQVENIERLTLCKFLTWMKRDL